MHAEIIAIGTELVLGATVDTNSAYLARQLATVGVPVRRVTLVGDDLPEIVAAIREALARAPLVICSGGLGPTSDDLTREAIAEATGRPLIFHQTLLDDIAARFAAFKRPMSDSNRQQAYAPEGAHIIRNPHGTAPAFVAERDGRSIAALPGVPQELQYLTEHALLPYLRQRYGLAEVLLVREVHAAGLTEAEASERLGELMPGVNPIVGISAKRGQYTIRIAARGASRADAERLIAPVIAAIEERFAGFLLDEETLEQRVGRLLAERGAQLTVIENDPAAPTFRALSATADGRRAIRQAIIRSDLPHEERYESAARRLARLGESRESSMVNLVALIEPGAAPLRNAHVALGTPHSDEPRYATRGVDFGLPDAHDFVATMALDLLRRWLESSARDSPGPQR